MDANSYEPKETLAWNGEARNRSMIMFLFGWLGGRAKGPRVNKSSLALFNRISLF